MRKRCVTFRIFSFPSEGAPLSPLPGDAPFIGVLSVALSPAAMLAPAAAIALRAIRLRKAAAIALRAIRLRRLRYCPAGQYAPPAALFASKCARLFFFFLLSSPSADCIARIRNALPFMSFIRCRMHRLSAAIATRECRDKRQRVCLRMNKNAPPRHIGKYRFLSSRPTYPDIQNR